MKDYFGIPLNTTVEVLDIDDDELKFEVEKYGKNYKWTS
jgi:hypothetical protein